MKNQTAMIYLMKQAQMKCISERSGNDKVDFFQLHLRCDDSWKVRNQMRGFCTVSNSKISDS